MRGQRFVVSARGRLRQADVVEHAIAQQVVARVARQCERALVGGDRLGVAAALQQNAALRRQRGGLQEGIAAVASNRLRRVDLLLRQVELTLVDQPERKLYLQVGLVVAGHALLATPVVRTRQHERAAQACHGPGHVATVGSQVGDVALDPQPLTDAVGCNRKAQRGLVARERLGAVSCIRGEVAEPLLGGAAGQLGLRSRGYQRECRGELLPRRLEVAELPQHHSEQHAVLGLCLGIASLAHQFNGLAIARGGTGLVPGHRQRDRGADDRVGFARQVAECAAQRDLGVELRDRLGGLAQPAEQPAVLVQVVRLAAAVAERAGQRERLPPRLERVRVPAQ